MFDSGVKVSPNYSRYVQFSSKQLSKHFTSELETLTHCSIIVFGKRGRKELCSVIFYYVEAQGIEVELKALACMSELQGDYI